LSVGPFNHPTTWLSAHEFQYRNLSDLYGETLVVEEDRPQGLDEKTVIGSDVWIGDNASVRRGVTIGSGAVIGMGTVVVKDVPPYAIVVGNPARIVRSRFAPDIVDSLLELKWWERDIGALGGIDFTDIKSAISWLRETF
jgi:acetyltransferase-like isoleucine patch superfamily enzyme